MFLYFFDDGTVQKHETAPTPCDLDLIEQGALLVLEINDPNPREIIPIQTEEYTTELVKECKLYKEEDDNQSYHHPNYSA